MNKAEARKEALYLIKNYTENFQYETARGVAELAHGIGIITDKQYEAAYKRIEKAESKEYL